MKLTKNSKKCVIIRLTDTGSDKVDPNEGKKQY